MSPFRPLRSRIFWLGFLALSALAWCWLDSTEYRTVEAFPVSGALYWSISSSVSAVHLISIESKATASKRPSGGFTRQLLSGPAPRYERLFPMPGYRTSNTRSVKGWELTLPYWAMILLGVSGAGALLEWRRRTTMAN